MQIFLSWSGELSKQIATIFYNWLPSVLQNATPYLSAEDIDKGEKWINSISKNLSDTSIGIIFVTKENVTAPWINYEIGALSNSLEAANVCPLLIDMSKKDIDSRSPLFHYQATSIEEKDIFKLLKTINNRQKENEITEQALRKTFGWAWSELDDEIKKVLDQEKKQKQEENKKNEKMIEESNNDAMHEILELLRSIKKGQVNTELENKVRDLESQCNILSERNERLKFMSEQEDAKTYNENIKCIKMIFEGNNFPEDDLFEIDMPVLIKKTLDKIDIDIVLRTFNSNRVNNEITVELFLTNRAKELVIARKIETILTDVGIEDATLKKITEIEGYHKISI